MERFAPASERKEEASPRRSDPFSSQRHHRRRGRRVDRVGRSPALADAYLAGGARFIQIRCKQAPSGAFLAMCEDVVARARPAGAHVIVNDRADIARLSAADGVHVGQDDLDPAAARAHPRAVRPHRNLDPFGGSGAGGVDDSRWTTLPSGPIFGTSTKDTGYREVGTAFVSEAAAILRDAATPGRSWRSAVSRSSARADVILAGARIRWRSSRICCRPGIPKRACGSTCEHWRTLSRNR